MWVYLCGAGAAAEQGRGWGWGWGYVGQEPGLHSAGVAERSYPTSRVRGGSREELPHVQGAAAAWVQEGQKELLYVQGQEGWP